MNRQGVIPLTALTALAPLAFFGGGILGGSAAFAQEMGRVVSVETITEVWKGAETPRPLQVRDAVEWGMTLRTRRNGSAIVVRLPPDREALFLGSNTQLTLNEHWREDIPDCLAGQNGIFSVQVEEGTARSLVQKAQEECTLVVGTPHALILVRRTDVRVAVTDRATLVVVVEGEVEVWSRDGETGSRVGAPVRVPAGESLLATAGTLLPGNVLTNPLPSSPGPGSVDPPLLPEDLLTPLPAPKPPVPLPGLFP